MAGCVKCLFLLVCWFVCSHGHLPVAHVPTPLIKRPGIASGTVPAGWWYMMRPQSSHNINLVQSSQNVHYINSRYGVTGTFAKVPYNPYYWAIGSQTVLNPNSYNTGGYGARYADSEYCAYCVWKKYNNCIEIYCNYARSLPAVQVYKSGVVATVHTPATCKCTVPRLRLLGLLPQRNKKQMTMYSAKFSQMGSGLLTGSANYMKGGPAYQRNLADDMCEYCKYTNNHACKKCYCNYSQRC